MAMKGLSLDGAEKLKKALDAYADACYLKSFTHNSCMAYGKNTKIQKLADDIVSYAFQKTLSGHDTITRYQNQLNQIINKYKGFDNTGNSTLGKVMSTKKS